MVLSKNKLHPIKIHLERDKHVQVDLDTIFFKIDVVTCQVVCRALEDERTDAVVLTANTHCHTRSEGCSYHRPEGDKDVPVR